ncbi:CehA/McbA family metallohydrolase [Fundicoccus culcitae]|uniref:CehA/McbA family metallohydrolase n=1 Tax=Fundicoccus culcitae TaxID=2969821 RepID=A0ABY5P4W7_9LACT|nr:CehA/McbA family metallohydrolase [Fundicoccus culcitae]UUX33782.1 CehA/McbA family metallohydrolase [Fundicoccus culcitae]
MQITNKHIYQYKIETYDQKFFFDVNEQMEYLELRFSFNLQGWQRVLVYDSQNNIRGQFLNYHSLKKLVFHPDISYCSTGVIAEKIYLGQWMIRVIDDEKIASTLTMTVEFGSDLSNLTYYDQTIWFVDGNYTIPNKSIGNTGWYKGDLHTHTNSTDGNMSAEKLTDEAERLELDFFAITDHDFYHLKWPKTKLIVLPGVEITAIQGHFNVIGLKKIIDWTPNKNDQGFNSNIGINRLFNEFHAQDAIVSINHPFLDECMWTFNEVQLENVDAIEIINDPTYPDNLKANKKTIQFWTELLNEGYRITGIGGSDVHYYPTEYNLATTQTTEIGLPLTHLYMEACNKDNIVKSIANGMCYVTNGIDLEFNIKMNNETIIVGQRFTNNNTVYPITYEVSVKGVPNVHIQFILNGELIDYFVQEETRVVFQIDISSNKYHWLRCDIYDKEGLLLGFINPIYFGEKEITKKTWGEFLSNND